MMQPVSCIDYTAADKRNVMRREGQTEDISYKQDPLIGTDDQSIEFDVTTMIQADAICWEGAQKQKEIHFYMLRNGIQDLKIINQDYWPEQKERQRQSHVEKMPRGLHIFNILIIKNTGIKTKLGNIFIQSDFEP